MSTLLVGKPGISSPPRVTICSARIWSECGGGRLHASYLKSGTALVCQPEVWLSHCFTTNRRYGTNLSALPVWQQSAAIAVLTPPTRLHLSRADKETNGAVCVAHNQQSQCRGNPHRYRLIGNRMHAGLVSLRLSLGLRSWSGRAPGRLYTLLELYAVLGRAVDHMTPSSNGDVRFRGSSPAYGHGAPSGAVVDRPITCQGSECAWRAGIMPEKTGELSAPPRWSLSASARKLIHHSGWGDARPSRSGRTIDGMPRHTRSSAVTVNPQARISSMVGRLQ